MAAVPQDRRGPRTLEGLRSPPRWRGAIAAPRTLFEALFFVLLPLIGPAMVVAYLIGAYQPRPGLVDGVYFPDGGFLFEPFAQ